MLYTNISSSVKTHLWFLKKPLIKETTKQNHWCSSHLQPPLMGHLIHWTIKAKDIVLQQTWKWKYTFVQDLRVRYERRKPLLLSKIVPICWFWNTIFFWQLAVFIIIISFCFQCISFLLDPACREESNITATTSTGETDGTPISGPVGGTQAPRISPSCS